MVLFSEDIAWISSTVLFVAGVLLNLWTLQALGIKGMYNGDSFGHLMKEPVCWFFNITFGNILIWWWIYICFY